MNPTMSAAAAWAEVAPTLTKVLTDNSAVAPHRYFLCQALLLRTRSHIDLLETLSPFKPTDKAIIDTRSSTMECLVGPKANISKVTLIGQSKGLVVFGSKSTVQNVLISSPKGFGIIVFGPNVELRNLVINVSSSGAIIFGSGTTATGLNIQVGESGDYVVVGDDCMFSTSVAIRTSDSHGIYDASTLSRINHSKPVILHNHVWIGRQVNIGKGAEVGSDAVIGQSSVVGSRLRGGSIHAGVPAKELRQGITWDRLKADTLDPAAPTAAYRVRQIDHEKTCAAIADCRSRPLVGLTPDHAISRILATDMDLGIIQAYAEELEQQNLPQEATMALEAYALRLRSVGSELPASLTDAIQGLQTA